VQADDFQSSGAMRLIAHRLGEVETTMKTLAHNVEKLVIIEERLMHYAQAQERAFNEIKGLDERLTDVESKIPDADRVTLWMDRGLWSIAAAALMYIAKNTGLLG
jgi:hypothetical protein